MKSQKSTVKSILSLGVGILRKNKTLTAGLFVLYAVLTTLSVSANFNFTTVSGSIDRFMEDYHLPDALYYTDAVPSSFQGRDYPEGVQGIEPGIVMDVHVKTSLGNTFYITMFSIEDDGFKKYYKLETDKAPEGVIPVWITKRFADSNHIKAGDKVTVRCPQGERECFVETIVSRPEGMFCTRNEFSWMDASEYGYMYMRRSDIESAFDLSDAANVWAYLFEDSLNEKEENALFEDIEESFDGVLKNSIHFREYLKEMKITDDIKKMEGISVYVPLFSYFIGLGFSCLFIYLIIRKQRRDISFLMALGYTGREIFLIFLLYCIVIGISGIITGCGLGVFIVRYGASVAQNSYSLPEVYYFTTLTRFVITIVLLLLVEFFSCLFCIKSIIKVNPAEVFSNQMTEKADIIPGWMNRMKMSPFFRFSVALLCKNRKRLIISSLSISCCIMLMLFGLEYAAANAAVRPAVFEQRFCYDYLIQYQGGMAYFNEAAIVDGVAVAEPVIAFNADISTSEMQEDNIQINALIENSTLIVPQDIDGNKLDPGNGIIMDEKLAEMLSVSIGDIVFVDDIGLRITSIAGERANSILYVSMDTARELGYDSPNQMVVKCKKGADLHNIRNDFDSINGFCGITDLEKQKVDMKNTDKLINVMSWVEIILIFLLGTILIYIMVVLSIEDNRRDYALLNALGVGASSIVKISFLENFMMYIIAVLIGVPSGIMSCKLAFPYMGSTTKYYLLTQIGRVSVHACLISLIYIVLGIVFTIYQAINVDPANALQN